MASGDHELRMSEVLSALSYALDITEGQPQGHAVRSCLIGMRIAEELGLDADARSSLFYALLLKDAGCSSNAAKICSLFRGDDLRLKRGVKTVDWARFSDNLIWAVRNVAADGTPLGRAAALVKLGLQQGTAKQIFETRCERGADIAREFGFPEATAEAIRTLDEHWDGRGQPYGRLGEEIPLLGRIVCLAQTVDIFAATHGLAAGYRIARERSGTWFDPEVVRALEAFEGDGVFWSRLSADDVAELVSQIEPPDRVLYVDDDALDRIADTFARVIDAKSPYTARHSERVAPFRELASDAASHHEKLDGSGYPLGLEGDAVTETARILAVADVFEALTAARPYRGPMTVDVALGELEAEAGTKLDDRCVSALRKLVGAGLA